MRRAPNIRLRRPRSARTAPAPAVAACSPIRANGSPRAIRSARTKLVELLCTDQVDRWRAGERIPAEAYLVLHPTLRGGSEAAFELIYGEYLVRESLGDAPKLEEFCWRFPEFADRLRRQLSLHSALGEAPERTEVGPGGEPGGGRGRGPGDPDGAGVRGDGHPRPGGHERGLPGAAGRAQSPGRAQGDPREGLRRPRHRRAVPRRGRGRGALPAPQYHPGLRGRRIRRSGLPGAGVRRGRQPPAEARRQSPAAARGRAADRAARPGPALRPPARDRPPRPQAGQRRALPTRGSRRSPTSGWPS